MDVVLISGKAGSGKDLVAEYIKDELSNLGHKVLIARFADLLKYICKMYLDWDGVKDKYGRSLIQTVGTDIVRSIDENFWVNFIVKVLDMLKDVGKWSFVIIPDLRFPNELSVMRENFKTTHINVLRNNFVTKLNKDQLSHISENAINDLVPDLEIINDGTKEQLLQKIKKIIKENFYE